MIYILFTHFLFPPLYIKLLTIQIVLAPSKNRHR
nr:MAG TPA: hypothetical protein [Caudoviricetes sp.]